MLGLYEWLTVLVTMVRQDMPSIAEISLTVNFVGDPAIEMYKQAILGDVDVITGDYLAGKPWALEP